MEQPNYYQPLMPYLIVEGATKFIEFAQKAFEAEVKLIVPRSEGIIQHGEMTIGKGAVMFADATEQFSPFPAAMFLFVEDMAKTHELALQAGATSIQDVTETDHGLSAGLKDVFGNIWWLGQK